MSDYILLTEKTHKARKAYFCSHCAEPIPRNEQYVYTTGAIHGTIQVDRWHVNCRTVINDWNPAERDAWRPGVYQRGTLKKKWDF
jgi:hypothetical protein